MGLLRAIDRVFPDEQIMGLLREFTGGGGSAPMPPPAAPQAGGYQGMGPEADGQMLAPRMAPPPMPMPQAPRAPQAAQHSGPGFGTLLSELIVNGQTFGDTRKDYAAQERKQQLLGELGGLLGGPGPSGGQGGQVAPISDPRWGRAALIAKQSGVDISQVFDWLKANQPDVAFDNGIGYNKRDAGQVGKFHPSLEKGQEPLFNARGEIVGIRNMDGSVQAAADMAGAVAGAQESAKAGLDLVDVPQSDGSTRKMPRLAAVQALGGGQGRPAGAGGPAGPAAPPAAPGVARGGPALGVSQSPAEAAAAKIAAEAKANAKVDLPRVQQTATQALSVIDKALTHPSLKARTGLSGLLPAFPGTKDAGFDAIIKQIHGKTFLEAFQSLKGAGQITEIEGAKATDAIARLDRAQSAEDFTAALQDLRDVVSTGMERAKAQAGEGRGPTMAGKGFKILSVE